MTTAKLDKGKKQEKEYGASPGWRWSGWHTYPASLEVDPHHGSA